MRITIKTLLFLLIIVTGQAQQKTNTPNIVLIFMDDMGYGDLSCYGALDIHTPNIDRLASEGIRFTNFLSSQAVCSASRASIMTGGYANRVGISGALFPGSKVGLASEEMTIAELLKQKNYATAIYGKWHLGDAKQFLPLQQGFDEYLGIPYSNDMWPVTYDGKPADSSSSKSRAAFSLRMWSLSKRSLAPMTSGAFLTSLGNSKLDSFGWCNRSGNSSM